MDLFDGKDISDSSKKLYTHNLVKLNGNVIKNLNFLLKTDDILKKLEALKPNTRRSYFIAISSVLKDKPKYKKAYDVYYPHLLTINKELKNNTTKSEKATANWITQDEVKAKQKELESILPLKKKTITKEQYDALLNLVVLSLYTLNSPRRNKDYIDMVYGKGDDKKLNYLDGDKFIFNNYKTAKTYKEQIVDISPELLTILNVYKKYRPKENNNFLVMYDGAPLKTSTQMTRMLNKIFGKKIGCSMLRAIFLTDKYSDVVKDLKEDSADMGTSSSTAMSNYIKQD
jgi:integrase